MKMNYCTDVKRYTCIYRHGNCGHSCRYVVRKRIYLLLHSEMTTANEKYRAIERAGWREQISTMENTLEKYGADKILEQGLIGEYKRVTRSNRSKKQNGRRACCITNYLHRYLLDNNVNTPVSGKFTADNSPRKVHRGKFTAISSPQPKFTATEVHRPQFTAENSPH